MVCFVVAALRRIHIGFILCASRISFDLFHHFVVPLPLQGEGTLLIGAAYLNDMGASNPPYHASIATAPVGTVAEENFRSCCITQQLLFYIDHP